MENIRESVFNTPSSNKPKSGTELLEAAKTTKNNRTQNLKALTEAYKLRSNFKDTVTPTLEAAERASERKNWNDHVLEEMTYRRGSQLSAKNALTLKPRVLKEARQYIAESVLYKIIYESYYLDEPVKGDASEAIEATIENTLTYIEENCKSSKVAKENYSKFLVNVEETVNKLADKVTTRITEGVIEADSDLPDIELTEDEYDELDEDLCDLGKDEIVDLVKTKVADVIQDEKARGEAKTEIFNELDEIEKDIGNTEGEEGTEEPDEEGEEPTKESAILTEGMNIRIDVDGSVIAEPYQFTMEAVFSNLPVTSRLSPGENRVVRKVLESDNTIDLCQHDPTWTDFKNYVSGTASIIAGHISNGNYRMACDLIDKYTTQLGTVHSDTVPTDVIHYVSALTSSIYSKVPPEEVNIFRLTNPDGMNPFDVDLSSYGWNGLLGNINVNLTNVKNWCITKLRDVAESANFINFGAGGNTSEVLENIRTQGFFITRDNISYRFNEFRPEKGHNIMLVTGIYGSGKTTLSNFIAAEHKAEVFQLEWVENYQLIGSPQRMNNYGLSEYIEKTCLDMLKNEKLYPTMSFGDLVKQVFSKIVEYADKHPKNMFIVEGLHVAACLHDYPDITRFPMVIMGASVVKSMKQYIKQHGLDVSATNLLTVFLNANACVNSFRYQMDFAYKNQRAAAGYAATESVSYQSMRPDPLAKLKESMMVRKLSNDVGGTLFEAMMIGNLSDCEATMESTAVEEGDIEASALVQSLLEYTVFETLSTLGIYNFRLGDIDKCKHDFVHSVSESKSKFQQEDSNNALDNNKKRRRLTKHLISANSHKNNQNTP